MPIPDNFTVTPENRQQVIDHICVSFRICSAENQRWMMFGVLHFKKPEKGTSFKAAIEMLDNYSLTVLYMDFRDNQFLTDS